MAYKKLLTFFIRFQVPQQGQAKNRLNTKNISYVYRFKNEKGISNLTEMLNMLYKCLRIVNKLQEKKATILFVGNQKEYQKLSFIFKKESSHIFVMNKWLNGLLTNWDQFLNFINQFKEKQPFINRSKRLRFFRFFSNIKEKAKPDFIILFNPKENQILLNECFLENIPVISLVSTEHDSTLISYQIPANLNSFSTQWFFLQIFIIQVNKLK